VDYVLRKATAGDREDRFGSASELATALLQAAADPMAYNAPTEIDLYLSSPVRSKLLDNRSALSQNLRRPVQGLSRTLSWFSLVIFLVIVLLLLLGGFTFLLNRNSALSPATQSVTIATATELPDIQQARASVQAYYDDWNKGDYLAAYSLLSSDYQKSYPYMYADYANVHYSCINSGDINKLANNRMQVNITIDAIENLPSGSGTAINEYAGYFIVQKIQGEWRLTPYLRLVSLHGTCVKP
jgi:hypothetical protein